MNRQFTIEIRDYESGLVTDRMTPARIERIITKLLEKDGSDGVVIVTEGGEATGA